VGYGVWRGAPVVREAKAIDPSGWTCAHGGNRRLRCEEIASGPYRSPDPWYRLTGTILVRRLSPNNRKLDLGEVRDPRELVNHPRTLEAMGRDLAAVHLGTRNGKVAIERDLRQRKGSLRNAVAAAAEFVRGEQKEWRSAYRNPS